MPVAFRSVAQGSVGATNGAQSLVINKPAGVVDGDVMIAVISSTGTYTPPSGWTSLGALTPSYRAEAWYRVASGEGASYTWSLADTDGVSAVGIIAAYFGQDLTVTIDADAEQANAASTSAVAPSVTATIPGDMLVCAFTSGNVDGTGGTNSSTPPAGMTERADLYRAQLGVDSGYGAFTYLNHVTLCDLLLTAAGATGGKAATLAVANPNSGHTVAIKGPPLAGVHMIL